MNKPNTQIIDQSWPAHELEIVSACPYCASASRTLAYKDVQDWSFYGAAGKWTYWSCNTCEALYLNPRPTEASIGKAYNTYYTHSSGNKSKLQNIKIHLKNEYLFHFKNANMLPRLHVSKKYSFLLRPLKYIINLPFGLKELMQQPKGKLLDVGCGSGQTLLSAQQLGWEVTGVEIDPNAVKAASLQGLNVVQGDFRQVKQFKNQFDCIICSHVLEHVHSPLDLLNMLTLALKPQGVLLLSLPNSKSHVLAEFGANWRGLEAPRHLGIPSLQKLTSILQTLGYVDIHQTNIHNSTVLESLRIKSRALQPNTKAKLINKFKGMQNQHPNEANTDFIQINAVKNSSH